MSDQTTITNPVENQTENIETQGPKYILKKGFKMNPDQRRKILAMPMKGFIAKINQQTGEMSAPVESLTNNERELCDYLICLMFEKSDGSAITEPDFCEMETSEYKEMQSKIKQINPFAVFDIKAFK